MKNVHLLPTDKPSRLYQKENRFQLSTHPAIDWYISSASYKPVNIYITFSDEEIKEGDWVISDQSLLSPLYDAIGKVEIISLETKKIIQSDNSWYWTDLDCKKIILTTDQDLINDGVQPIDNEFLEWFAQNPSCEFVEVDKNWNYPLDKRWEYKILIPQEELKQALVEMRKVPMTFVPDERMYSKEEVIAIVEKSRETGLTAEYLLLTDQFKKK